MFSFEDFGPQYLASPGTILVVRHPHEIDNCGIMAILGHGGKINIDHWDALPEVPVSNNTEESVTRATSEEWKLRKNKPFHACNRNQTNAPDSKSCTLLIAIAQDPNAESTAEPLHQATDIFESNMAHRLCNAADLPTKSMGARMAWAHHLTLQTDKEWSVSVGSKSEWDKIQNWWTNQIQTTARDRRDYNILMRAHMQANSNPEMDAKILTLRTRMDGMFIQTLIEEDPELYNITLRDPFVASLTKVKPLDIQITRLTDVGQRTHAALYKAVPKRLQVDPAAKLLWRRMTWVEILEQLEAEMEPKTKGLRANAGGRPDHKTRASMRENALTLADKYVRKEKRWPSDTKVAAAAKVHLKTLNGYMELTPKLPPDLRDMIGRLKAAKDAYKRQKTKTGSGRRIKGGLSVETMADPDTVPPSNMAEEEQKALIDEQAAEIAKEQRRSSPRRGQ